MNEAKVAAAFRALAEAFEESGPIVATPDPQGGMTYAKAAELLDCDPSTVGKLVRSGRLDGFLIGKRGTRVTRASVEKLVKQRAGVGPRRVA